MLLGVLAVGVGLVWFGTQTVGQEHSGDPNNKVFVASWIETQLWMNPWLVAIGGLMLATAVLLLLVSPRRPVK
jgi:hypothetical protein